MTQALQIREMEAAPSETISLRSSGGQSASLPEVILVHSGARDGYQLALALSERKMLKAFITDLFWPGDRPAAANLMRRLPVKLRAMLRQRSEPRIPYSEVRLCGVVGLLTLLLEKLPDAPIALRRSMMRYADATLGRRAGKLAMRSNADLFSYSYYAYDAFRAYGRPGMLFQLHPHPGTMRRILTEELEANNDCASSLLQEWELSLPEKDFQHLALEPTMASHILVASSFTKESLIEHGISPAQISVVPYGVDLTRFRPAASRPVVHNSKLNLLFVGRINQRKGMKYLLQALELLNHNNVQLTVCGRVVDDLELFKPFASRVTIRPSISADELVEAYQNADLFVFPSVAEGFGQVLLESMACGLPILSTSRTAAPDLVEEGVQGFIVEPCRPDLIAQRIEWAVEHREELARMGRQARLRAEQFTWTRFRERVVEVVMEHGRYQSASANEAEGRPANV
jgi:glycosyltransferase involved in cell wall biosynthesis